MNTESNQQSQFNPEEWMDRLLHSIETGKQFFIEFLEALKIMSQKGLVQAWKEVRIAASKLSAVDFCLAGMNIAVGLFGSMILLAGIGLLGYQSLLWLQNGVWTEYPLLTIFNFLFENTPLHQWIINPESWIGMQKLILWFLESIPVSIALMVPGFSIAITAAGIFVAALALRFYQLKKM
ncbi:MAG: hypothetical protein H8E32_08425 [Nitrospinae bacterium]|nr:hypothetical protein [Nitrospinota bacterium]